MTQPKDNGHASERTPLLDNAEGSSSSTQPPARPEPTPLPKLTIFLLSLTRVAEPLAFAILFPFVNSMVLSTGDTSIEGVGYYVGIIESMFSLTQMIFSTSSPNAERFLVLTTYYLVIPWGWAADRYGRKPVLLVSLVGAVVSTVLFGFSTKIWQMVAARCISGVFGGSAVVIRTVRNLCFAFLRVLTPRPAPALCRVF